ncbi:MAG TPA: response regulator [Cyclobacteriaceae bacterium]|jgi:CheY-like chemotaxis protein|nr:response regulator [Cyclobacteriaceae bacterium]
MQEFSLRGICADLVFYFNQFNSTRIIIDVKLNDIYLGSPDTLIDVIKNIFSFSTKYYGLDAVAIEITEKVKSGNFTTINIEFSNQQPKEKSPGILTKKKEVKINFSFELHSSNAQIKEKLPFESKKILLVDDSKISVMIFSCLLEEWGCKTTITENGEKAIDLAHASVYDLILMDNHMPILNGNAATSKIREFNKNTPIISLSFSDTHSEYSEALLAGANDFLHKPINSTSLFKVLSKYL